MRIATLFVAVVTFCVLATSSRPMPQGKPPIDTWLERELAKDSSTAGQRKAVHEAARRWDKEMNRAYEKLRHGLDSKQRRSLQHAQRAWVAYRDAEANLINSIYAKKQGTMWPPMKDNDHMAIIRARALQLREYDQLLKD